MRNSVFRYILIAAGVACMAACNDTTMVEEPTSGLILTVASPGGDAVVEFNNTKADPVTKPGVDELNENVINSVYYFLYQTYDAANAGIDAPKLHGYYSGLNFTDSKTWNIPVSISTVIDKLFPEGTRTCRAVVVANPPAAIVSDLESDNITLKQLRSLLVTSVLTGKQKNFTMVYDSEVTCESRSSQTILEVDAEVERLASKLTISADVAGSFTESGVVWKPVVEGLSVEFYNGMDKTRLDGDFDALKAAGEISDDSYFNVPAIGIDETTIETDNTSRRVSAKLELPFYSYPMEWDFNDKHEPSLLVELPWTNDGGSHLQYCYYRFFLNTKSLLKNSWYDITLQLDVIGSLNKIEPSVHYLYEHYQVLDWKNAFSEDDNNVDADIKAARYLVLENKNIVLKDVVEKSIPFTSSHEVEIASVKYSHANLANDANSVNNQDITNDAVWKECFKINGSVLEFSHALNDDINSPGLDATPYIFTIELRHKDNASYKSEITITQYPAITVTKEKNIGVGSNNYAVEGLNTRGDVYVNGQMRYVLRKPDGNSGYAKGKGWACVAPDNADGSNAAYNTLTVGDGKDRFMYVVEVQTVPNDSRYIITDPRNTVPNKVMAPQGVLSGESPQTEHTIFQTGENGYLGYFKRKDDNNIEVWYNNAGTNNADYTISDSGHEWSYYARSASAPALYYNSGESGNRQEHWCYATLTTEQSKDFIAPKFRIASPWCGASASGPGTSYYDMVRRCASYQEAGYPAGRWRLPTEAEINFVLQLQKQQIIPSVFTAPDGVYWCATGGIFTDKDSNGELVITPNTDSSNTRFSVRCVYDEWYWENTDGLVSSNSSFTTTNGRLPDKKWDNFVWGDMPIN